jgi:hypothetical protein
MAAAGRGRRRRRSHSYLAQFLNHKTNASPHANHTAPILSITNTIIKEGIQKQQLFVYRYHFYKIFKINLDNFQRINQWLTGKKNS